MKPSPPLSLSTSRVHPAARRPRRLYALFLLVLAVAACDARPAVPTNRGPTWPAAIVSHSALVCAAPAHPSVAGGCVAQDAATGISLRVINAYADATSTVMQLQTTNTAAYPLVINWAPQLALLSGRTFQAVGGGSAGDSAIDTAYEPLLPEEMGPLVHFVATASFMVPMWSGPHPSPWPPEPPWLADLDHVAVSVPFALAPVRAGSYTYQQPPIVKQGIGVQVQWLRIAPAHSAFYGAAGGASIGLLFSGLPADLELLSFMRVLAQNTIVGGMQGNDGPGLVLLHIPGMAMHLPAFMILLNPPYPQDAQVQSSEPTVGIAGTVQLEVIYQGSGVPTGQPATMSISQIQRLRGGMDPNASDWPWHTLPTFEITLPLPRSLSRFLSPRCLLRPRRTR